MSITTNIEDPEKPQTPPQTPYDPADPNQPGRVPLFFTPPVGIGYCKMHMVFVRVHLSSGVPVKFAEFCR